MVVKLLIQTTKSTRKISRENKINNKNDKYKDHNNVELLLFLSLL